MERPLEEIFSDADDSRHVLIDLILDVLTRQKLTAIQALDTVLHAAMLVQLHNGLDIPQAVSTFARMLDAGNTTPHGRPLRPLSGNVFKPTK